VGVNPTPTVTEDTFSETPARSTRPHSLRYLGNGAAFLEHKTPLAPKGRQLVIWDSLGHSQDTFHSPLSGFELISDEPVLSCLPSSMPIYLAAISEAEKQRDSQATPGDSGRTERTATTVAALRPRSCLLTPSMSKRVALPETVQQMPTLHEPGKPNQQKRQQQKSPSSTLRKL
jgi:hypothetical protein